MFPLFLVFTSHVLSAGLGNNEEMRAGGNAAGAPAAAAPGAAAARGARSDPPRHVDNLADQLAALSFR